MTHLRFPSSLGFAFLAAAALAAFPIDAAFGQANNGPGNNYYPRFDSPINNNTTLQWIESKLNNTTRINTVTRLTLLVPVPTSPAGYALANDVEITAALGSVVSDYLAGNTSFTATDDLATLSGHNVTFSGDLEELIRETASYRKGSTGKFIVTATTNVLNFGGFDDAQRLAAVEAIARGATTAEPAQATGVVSGMLKLIAPTVKAPATTPVYATDADEIVRIAIEKSASLADAVVKAAIGVVKTVADTQAHPNLAHDLITDISKAAVEAIFESNVGATYMANKVGIGIGIATKAAINKTTLNAIATSTDVVNAITQGKALVDFPDGIKSVASLTTGLMKGFNGSTKDGGDPIDNIVTAMGNNLGATVQTYLAGVKSGFNAARSVSPLLLNDPTTVSNAVNATMPSDNIAAYVLGAAGWLEKAVPLIVSTALANDTVGNSDSLTDIVEAAVRGSAANTSKTILAAATWAAGASSGETHKLGQILQGAAQGLKGQPLYGTALSTAVASILKGSPLQTQTVNKVVTLVDTAKVAELARYGVTGVANAGATEALGIVSKVLSVATAKTALGYQSVLQGAIDSSSVSGGNTVSPSEQWRVVLGVMAGDKIHANDISIYARGADVPRLGSLSGYNSANDDQVIAGGNIITRLQNFPKQGFGDMYSAFAAPNVTGTEANAIAVLTGATLALPANAAVAAALAVKLTNASDANIRKTAIAVSPALAKNIGITITVAEHVKASTSDLFDYIDQLIFKNSKNATDIVTGATVVQPEFAHIIAHAAGFRAPALAAKVVPALFNYSHVTALDPVVHAPLFTNYHNTVDVTAAITAGLTKGILEAKTITATKPLIEQTYLKSAISALVKQTMLLHGNGAEGQLNFRQYNPGDTNALPGGYTLTEQVGAAGAITGILSQVFNPANNTIGGQTGDIGTILTAAATIVKKTEGYVLAIAQAAAQTMRLMNPNFSDTGTIVNAINAGLGALVTTTLTTRITNAIAFGYTEADAGTLPAGAAGVINFIKSPITGAPVTSIFEL